MDTLPLFAPWYGKGKNKKKSLQENEVTMRRSHILEDILNYAGQVQDTLSGLSLELTTGGEWIVWLDYWFPFSIYVW